MTKPKWVLEIEKHTGCRTVLETMDGDYSVWKLQSLTDVTLFKFGGCDSIGMCSQPDMFNLTGISKEERAARRKAEG